MATRSSGRKRKLHQPIRDHDKSSFQLQLEAAIESPGGTAKILRLVQTAEADAIAALNAVGWTPLVGATFRLGKNTTRHGHAADAHEALANLVRACHQKGLSPYSGAWFGGHFHRPLVVAAYYGFHDAVRLLIELGALPDLGDGEGRNAWHAAFENPVARKGLRECDKLTAQALLDLGVVTNDLGRWRRAPKGAVCYMNGDTRAGSVMFRAVTNKNVDVVRFLCNARGGITDRDYLLLRNRSWLKTRLLPMVKRILADGSTTLEGETNATNAAPAKLSITSWSRQIDWSFPPTWKVGVILCQHCGLPSEIFRSYVLPYLDREWFYTRFGRCPDPLGPSCGEAVYLNRVQLS